MRKRSLGELSTTYSVRTHPEALIREFNRYGETAVIDLDGALSSPEDGAANTETKNSAILKKLLRMGNTRTGGGIRSVKKAKELIALGAEKIIVSSAAFTSQAGDGSMRYGLNEPFLESLAAAVGKERIIVSVDARGGRIALHGWKTDSGLDVVESARQAEAYCSELLFTCVKREGGMSGIDMDIVRKLRAAVKCRLVAAGGVSSVEEIAALEKTGCDVQLGMALYTGKVPLSESFIACLNWEKSPLIPVIAQSETGEVLMLGYVNQEALRATFQSGYLTFWSRSRNKLWQKGETSGNTLEVLKVRADCDRDTVLATVRPKGGVGIQIHKGFFFLPQMKHGCGKHAMLEYVCAVSGMEAVAVREHFSPRPRPQQAKGRYPAAHKPTAPKQSLPARQIRRAARFRPPERERRPLPGSPERISDCRLQTGFPAGKTRRPQAD